MHNAYVNSTGEAALKKGVAAPEEPVPRVPIRGGGIGVNREA